MSLRSSRVLIVDDDPNLAQVLGAELTVAGYACDVAESGAAALSRVSTTSFDAVVSDLKMEGMSGLDLLGILNATNPNLPVIMMTASSEDRAADVMQSGAFHYLTKPFEVDELKGVIEQAISDRGSLSKPERTAQDALLPMGPSSCALLAKIDRLASADAPVLIQGESGSGKELVAHAIHERSRRRKAPFVALNVAAIPEELLESEIFGHVRGAFSGATQTRSGLLVKAHQGTLLLDEIGEMPKGLQAKLLRALQSGEVRPIGSDHATMVDVRFLAATHRNLRTLVQKGSFREDLYFRLHVLALDVPALRDRKLEIPGLVAHFLAVARTRNPEAVVRYIAPDAMRLLTEARWPGNVRELASVVERLVVMGDKAVITAPDLALAGFVTMSPADVVLSEAQAEWCTLDHLTQRYAASVLAHTQGNKVEAARILDVNLSTLYRWERAHRQLD